MGHMLVAKDEVARKYGWEEAKLGKQPNSNNVPCKAFSYWVVQDAM